MADIRSYVRDAMLRLTGLSQLEAQDLEIGVFNASIDYASGQKIPVSWASDTFKEVYLAKSRSMLANLMPGNYVGNTTLSKRLADREFLPHDLPFMARESLFEDLWRPLMQKEAIRSREAYEFHQAAMTDLIKCNTCAKKKWKSKITYYHMQTRSSDEPMSTFVTCLTCRSKWKFG